MLMPLPSTINMVVLTILDTGRRSVRKVSQGLDKNGGMMVDSSTKSDLRGERAKILTSHSILTTTMHQITHISLALHACINYIVDCQGIVICQ